MFVQQLAVAFDSTLRADHLSVFAFLRILYKNQLGETELQTLLLTKSVYVSATKDLLLCSFSEVSRPNEDYV